MLPCGTPDNTLLRFESLSPILTHCTRVFKYVSSQDHSLPEIPRACNFDSKALWETESNAFLKSIYMTSTSFLLFLPFNSFSVKRIIASYYLGHQDIEQTSHLWTHGTVYTRICMGVFDSSMHIRIWDCPMHTRIARVYILIWDSPIRVWDCPIWELLGSSSYYSYRVSIYTRIG